MSAQFTTYIGTYNREHEHGINIDDTNKKSSNVLYIGFDGDPKLTFKVQRDDPNQLKEFDRLIDVCLKSKDSFEYEIPDNNTLIIKADFGNQPNNTWLNVNDTWVSNSLPYTITTYKEDFCVSILDITESDPILNVKYCRLSNGNITYSSSNNKDVFVIGMKYTINGNTYYNSNHHRAMKEFANTNLDITLSTEDLCFVAVIEYKW